MKIDGFMSIFKVIFILEVLKIANSPFALFCGYFSLICDDCVFTQEQMMLQVIKFLTEKLDDEFFFNICFNFM